MLPEGVVIRQDYDGLQKEYSQRARLICDPDLVVMVDQEVDGRIIQVETYPGRSMTRQSEKDQADINKILERMQQQGIGPSFNPQEPRFLDISAVGNYREALDQVNEARKYFMELDAEDRARFRNDPAVFLDTVNDPVKLRQLIAEGIVVDGSIVGGPVPAEAGGAGAPGGGTAVPAK